jgi:uncharacterized protein DUF6265
MGRLARMAVALSLIVPAAVGFASEAPATKHATLAQVAWIAGHWVDDSEGGLSEEVWTAPSGDSMIGMWRYVAKGKVQIFELLSITEEDGGPVFRLRHFSPRMVAREEKDKPLALPLVSLEDREASFEGPGQPSGTIRLTYRQAAADVLSVTLDKDGTTQTFPFRRKNP